MPKILAVDDSATMRRVLELTFAGLDGYEVVSFDSGDAAIAHAQANGADLVIAESTLQRPERTGIRGHMTPAEAGDHAERAGAKQLVPTHISDELEPEWAIGEARKAYSGPVQVAFEGLEIEV